MTANDYVRTLYTLEPVSTVTFREDDLIKYQNVQIYLHVFPLTQIPSYMNITWKNDDKEDQVNKSLVW